MGGAYRRVEASRIARGVPTSHRMAWSGTPVRRESESYVMRNSSSVDGLLLITVLQCEWMSIDINQYHQNDV